MGITILDFRQLLSFWNVCFAPDIENLAISQIKIPYCSFCSVCYCHCNWPNFFVHYCSFRYCSSRFCLYCFCCSSLFCCYSCCCKYYCSCCCSSDTAAVDNCLSLDLDWPRPDSCFFASYYFRNIFSRLHLAVACCLLMSCDDSG